MENVVRLNKEENALLTLKEASTLLGISTSTLYKWVHYRKITFIKTGRLLKFHLKELQNFISENTTPKIA